jgi:glycosyltransferase involved in cell wall biosynthesis
MASEYEPYILGGLGVVATNLTGALREKDLKITVLSKSPLPGMKVSREKYFELIRFPRNPGYYSVPRQKFNYEAIMQRLKKTGFRKPDLIHIHSVEFAHLARYLQNKYSIPVVYTCHSLVAHEGKSTFREMVADRQVKLLQSADRIVSPSQWERAELERLYPFSKDKIAVIENGVKLQVKGGKPVNPYHLLFVGRLLRMKGIEQLLQAVAILASKNPKVKLDVVGKGTLYYTKHLKMMARRLGIQATVRWLGYRPPSQVQAMYSSYGAVVVPSLQESFGLVALEALANKVPLVSTRSGGLSQFVTEDVAQIITRVTPNDIAKAIRNVWTEKKMTGLRVKEGFKVAEPHAWSVIADRYRELFASMVDGREL